MAQINNASNISDAHNHALGVALGLGQPAYTHSHLSAQYYRLTHDSIWIYTYIYCRSVGPVAPVDSWDNIFFGVISYTWYAQLVSGTHCTQMRIDAVRGLSTAAHHPQIALYPISNIYKYAHLTVWITPPCRIRVVVIVGASNILFFCWLGASKNFGAIGFLTTRARPPKPLGPHIPWCVPHTLRRDYAMTRRFGWSRRTRSPRYMR